MCSLQTVIVRVALALLGLGQVTGLLSAQMSPEQLAYELSIRYTPYTNGAQILDLELIAELDAESWWSTPEAIRVKRSEQSRPLSGLHLALDPGHIGGHWAAWEGRNFRISDADYWVREGELVLEVAQRVRDHLEELGAKVSLLRETNAAINPKSPMDYWDLAARELGMPEANTLRAHLDHALAVRDRAVRHAIIIGELAERARRVNEVIRPDALISLHINAAPWPEADTLQLVNGDHVHVLIFGCLSETELSSPGQAARLIRKLINGSGPIESALGAALGQNLVDASGLPASMYEGANAIRLNAEVPSLWARNLMLLRLVDCPVVLLEPYVANSRTSYARLQSALASRASGDAPAADDILVEYADAVVAAVLQTYGPVNQAGAEPEVPVGE